jgi:hypothetical protein
VLAVAQDLDQRETVMDKSKRDAVLATLHFLQFAVLILAISVVLHVGVAAYLFLEQKYTPTEADTLDFTLGAVGATDAAVHELKCQNDAPAQPVCTCPDAIVLPREEQTWRQRYVALDDILHVTREQLKACMMSKPRDAPRTHLCRPTNFPFTSCPC